VAGSGAEVLLLLLLERLWLVCRRGHVAGELLGVSVVRDVVVVGGGGVGSWLVVVDVIGRD